MARRPETATTAPAAVPFPHPPDDGGRAAADLYERDFHTWAVEQAALLRGVAERAARGGLQGTPPELGALDYANLAEELEGLARSDRRELHSRLRTIIEHLAKLEFSTADEPRPKWRITVLRARADIERLLKDSPSLRAKVPELLAEAEPEAVELAAAAMGDFGEREAAKLACASLDAGSRYGIDRVLGWRWWPKRWRPEVPDPTPGDKRPRVRPRS